MSRVRLIAFVYGVMGWVTVVLGGISVLVLVSQVGKLSQNLGGGGGSAFLVLIGGLIGIILIALGPFTLWAGLTALCEIHEREEQLQHAVSQRA